MIVLIMGALAASAQEGCVIPHQQSLFSWFAADELPQVGLALEKQPVGHAHHLLKMRQGLLVADLAKQREAVKLVWGALSQTLPASTCPLDQLAWVWSLAVFARIEGLEQDALVLTNEQYALTRHTHQTTAVGGTVTDHALIFATHVAATKGFISNMLGRGADSVEALEAATKSGQRLWGDDHSYVQRRRTNLGLVLASLGRDAQAIALNESLLAQSTRTVSRMQTLVTDAESLELGAAKRERVQRMANLASVLNQAKQYESARRVILSTVTPEVVSDSLNVPAFEKRLLEIGGTPALTASSLYHLVLAEFGSVRRGQWMLAAIERAIEIQREVASDRAPITLASVRLKAQIDAHRLGKSSRDDGRAQNIWTAADEVASIELFARQGKAVSTNALRSLEVRAEIEQQFGWITERDNTIDSLIEAVETQRSMSTAGLALDALRFAQWEPHYRSAILRSAQHGQCTRALTLSRKLKGNLLREQFANLQPGDAISGEVVTRQQSLDRLTAWINGKDLSIRTIATRTAITEIQQSADAGTTIIDWVLVGDSLVRIRATGANASCDVAASTGLASTIYALSEWIAAPESAKKSVKSKAPEWRPPVWKMADERQGFVLSVVKPNGALGLAADWNELAHWLDQRLFASDAIGARLAFSVLPDHLMHDLPWHVLPTMQLRSQQFVGVSVRATQSSFKEPALRSKPWFIVAATELPLAKHEARDLMNLAPARSQLFKERAELASASRQSYNSPSLVHIAAHAQSTDKPLAASMAPEQASPITAQDLIRWRLAPDLMVLSGCATARGAAVSGEGAMGLAYAALAGGARTVLASQWPVDDAATAFFMKAFYKALMSGAAPSAALQQAQRQTRRDPRYAEPFYWAAFVLLG